MDWNVSSTKTCWNQWEESGRASYKYEPSILYERTLQGVTLISVGITLLLLWKSPREGTCRRSTITSRSSSSNSSSKKDVCYVDWAGAALREEEDWKTFDSNMMIGNPHSSPAAFERMQDETKNHILQLLNGSKDYTILWTSGATDAIRLLSCDLLANTNVRQLRHSHNVHTSVLAMRNILLQRSCCHIQCVDIQELEQTVLPPSTSTSTTTSTTEEEEEISLVACPLECNLTGRITCTDKLAQRPSHWWWCCDIAKAASTSLVNLQSMGRPEFAFFSFYKLFGYPTGLGCLVVKTSILSEFLQPPAFMGGGTMSLSLPYSHPSASKPISSIYTNGGTPHYQGIAAIHHLFTTQNIPLRMKLTHDTAMTCLEYFLQKASSMTFPHNQHPLFRLYTQQQLQQQGPTIACNIYHTKGDGSFVGIREVQQLASLEHIYLRVGCCCNPGACHSILHIQEEEIQELHSKFQYSCGHSSSVDFINYNRHRPTGVIRISFGHASTLSQVDTLLQFFQQHFLLPPSTMSSVKSPPSKECVLMEQYIYPIKSCRGIRVSSWPLKHGKLLYDRDWAIVHAHTGKAIRLQDYPDKLSQLQPHIIRLDNKQQLQLTILHQPHIPPLILPLDDLLQHDNSTTKLNNNHQQHKEEEEEVVSICGKSRTCMAQKIQTSCHNKDESSSSSSTWISNYIGVPCYFTRYKHNTATTNEKKNDSTVVAAVSSFANEAPLLVVTQESIQQLNQQLQKSKTQVTSVQFRPNWVVSSGVGGGLCDNDEDSWMELLSSHDDPTATTKWKVLGPCGRCAMIDICPNTGSNHTTSTLRALSRYRRQHGQINFGIFVSNLQHPNDTTNQDENETIMMKESTIFTIRHKNE